jgi:hypothetical protein
MATPPIVCPPNTAETAFFDRCLFEVVQNNVILNTMSFCDYSMDIDDFFGQTVRLRGNEAFLLDDAGLGNDFGEIKFLAIKVNYSANFTTDSDKYINLIYEGVTYSIGEFHIWTGQPTDSIGTGITVKSNGTSTSSPLLADGGIVLHNPHTDSVDLNIMIASTSTSSSTVPPSYNDPTILDEYGNYLTTE